MYIHRGGVPDCVEIWAMKEIGVKVSLKSKTVPVQGMPESWEALPYMKTIVSVQSKLYAHPYYFIKLSSGSAVVNHTKKPIRPNYTHIDQMEPLPKYRSWSIYTRPEIIQRYEILERVGAGAYSDVYRARRLSDDLIVALKEIHDYQSAFREIEALQILKQSPNAVDLIEYFWSEDEDAVLVLEFLRSDLSRVIGEAKKKGGLDLRVDEIKGWIVQILMGVDDCHKSLIVHRDLKPSNLLISDNGVLKLADFGQARILVEPATVAVDNQQSNDNINTDNYVNEAPESEPEKDCSSKEHSRNQEQQFNTKDEYSRETLNDGQPKNSMDEQDKEAGFNDGDTSCLATCTTSDREEDPFDIEQSYSAHDGENGPLGPLTSCVGTRWFRAPELLYGSVNYGFEIDLWSLGCIFAELFSLKPLFPGTSDIDQLSKIINILGNLNEEAWPGCVNLPDFGVISFNKVGNPIGIEACLPNRSAAEALFVRRLLCYDPARRATADEMLNDKYLLEEPIPAVNSELRVPTTKNGDDDDDSDTEWGKFRDAESDSDFDEFGPVNVSSKGSDFSIRFS